MSCFKCSCMLATIGILTVLQPLILIIIDLAWIHSITSYFCISKNECQVWPKAAPKIWWINIWSIRGWFGGESRGCLQDFQHKVAQVLMLTGEVFAVYQQLNEEEKEDADRIKTTLYTAFVLDSFMVYEQFIYGRITESVSSVQWYDWPRFGMCIYGSLCVLSRMVVFTIDQLLAETYYKTEPWFCVPTKSFHGCKMSMQKSNISFHC